MTSGDIDRMRASFLAGIYPDMPGETYHADPCREPSLSASLAGTLLKATPRHAWTSSQRLNPDWQPVEASHFDIGKAAHAVLTGVGEPIVAIDADDWRAKAAKEARDEARAQGKTPLLARQHAEVMEMVRVAHLQLQEHDLGDVFEGGDNEHSLFWEAGSVWNRCRPDNLDRARRISADYKTAAELADPEAWTRRAYAHGVDVRAAFYADGLDSLIGDGRPWQYVFVVQEKAPPYALSVVAPGEAMVEIGRRKVAEARALWRECLDADRWPAWSRQIALVEPPAWEISRWMERELRDADTRNAQPSKRLIDAAIDFQRPAARTAP